MMPSRSVGSVIRVPNGLRFSRVGLTKRFSAKENSARRSLALPEFLRKAKGSQGPRRAQGVS